MKKGEEEILKKNWSKSSMIVGLLLFSSSILFTSKAEAELKNGNAFSGKNSYYSSGGYTIVTNDSEHNSAYNNAISKINNISGADINLSLGGSRSKPINVHMSTVNSSSYDWYGHCAWNKTYATIRMNQYTTRADGFTQSNYNKTALHELGHAFYMEHQASGVSSVMKSGKYSYNDYTSLDKSNLAYQY